MSILRSKIKRTSLKFTEIWPISDRLIKQKYYLSLCITVQRAFPKIASDKLSKLDSKLLDIWNYFPTMSDGRRQTESLERSAFNTNVLPSVKIVFIFKIFRVRTCLKSTWIYRTVLKSPWNWNFPWKVLEKHKKAWKSPWILPFTGGFNTVIGDLNQYKLVVPLFGAAYAALNKGTTFLN